GDNGSGLGGVWWSGPGGGGGAEWRGRGSGGGGGGREVAAEEERRVDATVSRRLDAGQRVQAGRGRQLHTVEFAQPAGEFTLEGGRHADRSHALHGRVTADGQQAHAPAAHPTPGQGGVRQCI